MLSSPGLTSSDQACLWIFGSSWSHHSYSFLLLHSTNKKWSNVTIVLQNSFSYAGCLSVLVMPCRCPACLGSSQSAIFFSLLIVIDFSLLWGFLQGFQICCVWGGVEENPFFFHILISRWKKQQVLLSDHSPSLSYTFFPMLGFHMGWQRKPSIDHYSTEYHDSSLVFCAPLWPSCVLISRSGCNACDSTVL